MKTEKQMSMAATEFAERWKGRGYERGSHNRFGLTCFPMSLALKHHRMVLSLLKTIEWSMPPTL